jgi:hypothetical protein
VTRRFLTVGLLVALATAVHGHTGLPVTAQLFFDDAHGRLYVPTRSWGLFVGPQTPGTGDWQWICDEALDPTPNPRRVWAQAGSGTYVVSDFDGVRRSADGGCSWEKPSGAPAGPTAMVVADPIAPMTLWTATYSPTLPSNSLYRSDDDGVTWTPVFSGDENFDSIAVSSDGQNIWLGTTSRQPPNAPIVHISHDRGVSFSTVMPAYTLDAATPRLFRPLATVDGEPGGAWLSVIGSDHYALLRASNDAATLDEKYTAITETLQILVVPTGIWAVTSGGLQFAGANGVFAPAGDLAQSQCLASHGGALWACSSTYTPDLRAIGRSDDGGAHFSPIFQFNQTTGIMDCPAGSTVATQCPPVWQLYSEKLGVPQPGVPDGGTDMPPPGGGCSVVF